MKLLVVLYITKEIQSNICIHRSSLLYQVVDETSVLIIFDGSFIYLHDGIQVKPVRSPT